MNQKTKEVRNPFTSYSREEVMARLRENPAVWQKYLSLTEELQEEIVGFGMGDRGLPISSDPFFKRILSPERRGERLGKLLSQLIGEEVCVKRGLQLESERVVAEGAMLSLDVLAELKSGELANLEIQKIGYRFPMQRAACYSSDLMMRQYTRVKNQRKKTFSYQDLHNVYNIILIEKSTSEFHQTPGKYLHKNNDGFDSGLKLSLPQKFIFIALDVFREIAYTVGRKMESELDAWLLFLSSDRIEDIMSILEAYPFFTEIYEEIAAFQRKPEELIDMFSEELAIMDRNMVQYMIEEQQKELEAGKKELEAGKKELEAGKKELEAGKKELEAVKKELEAKDQELEHLRALLAQRTHQE